MSPTIASQVAVYCGQASYPPSPPYSPRKSYPEYRWTNQIAQCPNPAYDAVRGALILLGLDVKNLGLPHWNPLAKIVRPGDTVVLKPNLVREFRESQDGHGDCLITHGSVIRAILDYVFIALEGSGRIVLADAPHNDANFDAICRIAGLREIQEFYRRKANVDVEVYDLRPERADKIDGVIVGHEPLPGDPAGYVRVDLGRHSAFTEIDDLCYRLYGSEYDTREIVSHHQGGRHEYLISKTVLEADCVISIPKLKTHKKVGLTVNMKNLVGINGNKNWLPHHREGTPAQGGDQFCDNGLKNRVELSTVARFKRLFPLLGPLRPVVAGPVKAVGKRLFGDTNKDTIRSGNWHGNDTTWRMVHDLNRILMYSDAQGVLRDHPVRRFFSVVDGIIGGEGNGPLDPTPKSAGVILAGANPVAVDFTCARLMGFDWRLIPLLYRAFDPHERPIASFTIHDISVNANNPAYTGPISNLSGPGLEFKPHFGWRGHLELGCSVNETW